MAPDPAPSAALARIKKRAEAAAELNVDLFAKFIGPDTMTIGGWIAASAMDVPLLVAALEAVLALHVPIPDGQDWCRECGHSFPCWTLQAITSALTGEETGDGR
jgi:hypothetical protein